MFFISFVLVLFGQSRLHLVKPTLVHSCSSKWPSTNPNATIFLFFIQIDTTKFKDFPWNPCLRGVLSLLACDHDFGIPRLVWWCLVTYDSVTDLRLQPNIVHGDPNDIPNLHAPSWKYSFNIATVVPCAKSTWKTSLFQLPWQEDEVKNGTNLPQLTCYAVWVHRYMIYRHLLS